MSYFKHPSYPISFAVARDPLNTKIFPYYDPSKVKQVFETKKQNYDWDFIIQRCLVNQDHINVIYLLEQGVKPTIMLMVYAILNLDLHMVKILLKYKLDVHERFELTYDAHFYQRCNDLGLSIAELENCRIIMQFASINSRRGPLAIEIFKCLHNAFDFDK